MGKRLTHDVFESRVKAKLPDYTVIGVYVNKRTKIEVSCGNIKHPSYLTAPPNLLGGHGCKLCLQESIKKVNERKFWEVIANNYSDYKLTGIYENCNSEFTVFCGNEGHPEYTAKASCFLRGTVCVDCCGKSPRLAEINFRECITAANYKLLSEYVNSYEKVKVSCTKGHEYWVDSRSFKQGNRCLTCNGNDQKSAEERFLSTLESSGFTVESSYINKNTPVNITCKDGHLLKIRPNTVKKDIYTCRYCVNRFYGFDNTRPASLYLQLLSRSEKDKCFKYGITNRESSERMHEQELVSKYDHKLVYNLHSENGGLVEELERKISETHTTPYLDKEALRNGYRETVSFKQGLCILDMMKGFSENEALEIEGDFVTGFYSYGQWC